jgi:tetratricopeptide (TPR) repeat protein
VLTDPGEKARLATVMRTNVILVSGLLLLPAAGAAAQSQTPERASLPRSADRDPAAPVGTVETSGLRLLAEQRYLDGDLEGAATLFRQLAESSEEKERSAHLITTAWLEHLLGRRAAALDTLAQALITEPDRRLEADHYDGSFLALYEEARIRAEKERRAGVSQQLLQAQELLEAGDLDRAHELLSTILQSNLHPEQKAHTHYQLALVEMRSGRQAQALLHFESVLEVAGDQELADLKASALLNIGTIQYQQRLWGRAERSWSLATELDANEASSWRNLGLARSQRGNEEGALEALRRAHELEPRNAETTRYLARSLIRVGRPQEAVALLNDGLRLHPEKPHLWLALGTARRTMNESAPAKEAFERAIALDAGNGAGVAARAAAFLAVTLLAEADHGRAEEWALAALDWEGTSADYWNYLGIAQKAQEHLEGALASFEKSIELDSARPEFVSNLGAVYVELEQWDKAEQAFEKALQLSPSFAPAVEGLTLVREGRAVPAASTTSPPPRRTHSSARPLPPKKLGIKFADLDYAKLGLQGALIKTVKKRSPAARAGLRRGDLVLRVDSYPILDAKDFFQRLKRAPPAGNLDLEILRDGRPQSILIVLEEV